MAKDFCAGSKRQGSFSVSSLFKVDGRNMPCTWSYSCGDTTFVKKEHRPKMTIAHFLDSEFPDPCYIQRIGRWSTASSSGYHPCLHQSQLKRQVNNVLCKFLNHNKSPKLHVLNT